MKLLSPTLLASALTLVVAVGCSSVSTSASKDPSYGSAELPPAAMVDVTSTANLGGNYDFSDDLAEADMRERGVIASAPSGMAGLGDELTTWAPPARDAKGKQNEAGKKQTERVEAEKNAEAAVADGDDGPDHGREIIYVAGMQIGVYDLPSAIARVEALPDQYGGWVHMRNEQQVVLRLPARSLKPVMSTLAKLGVVEARSLQAQDVTAEYVDLDSRIKVLRDTQAQLLELLGKAKTVEEALHVRRALDDVTMQLETALGRMRQLDDLIAYSTLTVTLYERGPLDQIPTSNDPFRWVDSLGVEATEWR